MNNNNIGCGLVGRIKKTLQNKYLTYSFQCVRYDDDGGGGEDSFHEFSSSGL
jgi:hypothetical protein